MHGAYNIKLNQEDFLNYQMS
jgi:hypothetical protein